MTTQQFFASVTPASTQQAVVRPGWRGRGTPIGQGRAMGPAGIQGEEPARALLHELADFGIGVQVPSVVQVLLLLPAAGGTKVRESEYSRP